MTLPKKYFLQIFTCQSSSSIQRSWETLNLPSLSWFVLHWASFLLNNSIFPTISNVPLQKLLERSLWISLFSLVSFPSFLLLSHKSCLKMSRLRFVINKFNRSVLILIDRWIACVWQNSCVMCSTVGCCVYIAYVWIINSDKLISPVK